MGSGSTYAYGVLDKYDLDVQFAIIKLVALHKHWIIDSMQLSLIAYEIFTYFPCLFFKSYYRKDLTIDEAIELGKRAILHATHRDAYSGGINNGTHFLECYC